MASSLACERVWASASRPEVVFRFVKDRFRRFGVKTPSAELHYREWAKLFISLPPQCVYCMRDPVGIYDSLLSVSLGIHYQPKAVVAMLEQSWKAIQVIQKENFEFIFIFDLRQVRGNLGPRLQLGLGFSLFWAVPQT